ncbi:MAG TPA: nucleotidyltransferase domain-containing protein [Nitrospiria bacterium]|nr:nucleotidyltransferase domain-containing protein [Nitrospiria bacterium]
MSKTTQEVLRKLKTSLAKIYGERLKGLYLYGSYARGEERSGSDLDVAMILDQFERPWFEIQRTGQLVTDLSLECEITISLIPLRVSDWKEKQKSLVRNIQREGVAV